MVCAVTQELTLAETLHLLGLMGRNLPSFITSVSGRGEVLDLVAAGLDDTAIAHRLSLAPKTVRNTLATVLAELPLRDRSAAIVRARAEGLGGA